MRKDTIENLIREIDKLDDIKKEHNLVMTSVMNERRNLENLQKEIKKADKTLEERQGFLLLKQREVEKNERDIKIFLQDFSDEKKGASKMIDELGKQIKELEEKKEIEEKKIEQIKQEQEQAEIEKKKVVKDKEKELEGLQAILSDKKEEKKELIGEYERISSDLENKEAKKKNLIQEIQEKEKEKKIIEKEIEEKRIKKEKLVAVKEQKILMEQRLLEIKWKVKDELRKLGGINKERELRMNDIGIKEKEIDKKEQKLNEEIEIFKQKQFGLKEDEKRIIELGQTLQKNINKRKIPIEINGTKIIVDLVK